ncbi:unnamed protein product, partial [Pylaiella littoralis]
MSPTPTLNSERTTLPKAAGGKPLLLSVRSGWGVGMDNALSGTTLLSAVGGAPISLKDAEENAVTAGTVGIAFWMMVLGSNGTLVAYATLDFPSLAKCKPFSKVTPCLSDT